MPTPSLPMNLRPSVEAALREVRAHLEQGLIPFWLERGLDREAGGYLTDLDAQGNRGPDTRKALVPQARMLFGFSILAREYPGDLELAEAARHGFEFMTGRLWDKRRGGWVWMADRQGAWLDDGKLLMGQAQALQALAEYWHATGDMQARAWVEKTLSTLLWRCLDGAHGGFLEHQRGDWTASPEGFEAGDRKSLAGHLHLLEALISLADASGDPGHMELMARLADLIQGFMLDAETGAGALSFGVDFTPLPCRPFFRAWGATPQAYEEDATPLDATSYGQNLKLAWQFHLAGKVLDTPMRWHEPADALARHSLRHGFDAELGGLYAAGRFSGAATDTRKGWWQNAEALVGFVDAWEHGGGEEYLRAFLATWAFCRGHLIAPQGEWRREVDRAGAPTQPELGYEWKAMYHTGRAALECCQRLKRALEQA